MNFEPQSESEGPAASARAQAERAAEEYVQRGEACVSEHPETAVSVAFAGGLLLGILVGWFIAEMHQREAHSRGWRRHFPFS